MSRSRRKPYVTQGYGSKYRAHYKKLANNAVKNTKEAPANGNAYKKEFNSWDICDWKFHVPNERKWYRK